MVLLWLGYIYSILGDKISLCSDYIIKRILGDKAMLVEDEEPHAGKDGVEFAPLTR